MTRQDMHVYVVENHGAFFESVPPHDLFWTRFDPHDESVSSMTAPFLWCPASFVLKILELK